MEPSRAADLYRSQRTMIAVRWAALPWAIFQFASYEEEPYPPGAVAFGITLLALLLVGNAVIHVLYRREWGPAHAAELALIGISLDILVISGIVWLYAFDQVSALWALLFILPLEGAIFFQLQGALYAWGATTVIYIARDIYGSNTFDYPLEINSITYRMGIGAVIALVAGLMARDLVEQRRLVADALEEVSRVDQLRSGLISTLGHDVRNPLTVIRGAVETLLTRRERLDEKQIDTLLTGADRQARRLEFLAADLLDLARLEAGRLELRTEELHVASAARKALSYLEQPEGFETRIAEDLTITADPQRLEQVLYNLLANAIRYGKPPYVIEAERADGFVLIHVGDHGPGVPAQQQASLFEPFISAASGFSAGYGLAIVKALVESHGGRVSYSENQPHGARFSIELPA